MNRCLIVRLGALGDVVHAIPVAAALRRHFPSARIDWLVSAKHRELLELVPVIDDRVVASASAVGRLRRRHYDVAIDLQGLIKSAMFARLSGAARVVGFSANYVRERLASVFYTDAFDPGGSGSYDRRETRHVVDLNLSLLTVLDLPVEPPEFALDRVASTAADHVRAAAGGRYALLNPGAAWPNKRWPPDRFAAVARAIRDRHGLKSAVLWGPGEEALANAIVESAGGAALITPRTSVRDLVAIARGAAVMVSGDTGPTHIASAVGTPIVGIYGPTRPSRNGPLSPLDVSVTRDAICRCHHLRQCTQPRMCLLDIEVSEVVAAVDRRLAAEPAHA